MASPVDTSVKFALSTMVGAPPINGQAGSRIAAIKAFAVTGFGIKVVDTGGTISGGKCRLPFGSGASAAVVGSVVTVTGAIPTELNGEQRVTAINTAWVEYATTLPDGPVTGAPTFKIAPLGWEEVYFKANVSVFRPTDVKSSRPYIRIDDTNALFATVQMYESMSDVDTGIAASPARYWQGRSAASANSVSWVLAGDSRGLFTCVAPYTAGPADYSYGHLCWYAGDIISDRQADQYPALLMGNTTSAATAQDGQLFFGASSAGHLMRIAAGIGGASPTTVVTAVGGNLVSGADSTWGSFPSRAAQALFMVPVLVGDGGTLAATGRRGQLPGARYCPQTGVRDVYGSAPVLIDGTDDLLGKKLLSLGVGSVPNVAPTGCGFIDVTGPWRPLP